ncbi:MAG: RNA-directed DNA polymerase [Clostridia bacterium]|nr:RNA-directed DNA polymerase [Clostridia bacterium]
MIVYKELKSLESDLGFSLKLLYALSNNIKKHYSTVEIPKRSGGVRRLSVPDEILKGVQRRIAVVILSGQSVSRYASAYRYGASVVKNAAEHVGRKKVLKLDILHFFDSISYSAVKENAFPSERFSEPVRILLTLLCYYGDVLPQGAPSSPVITNIVMRDFDETVGAWCEEKGISYTRYCDDMTFSGDFDEKAVIDFVKEELRKKRLLLNYKKTSLTNRGGRQTVTGIVVNEKPNITSEYRRKLRQEVYYCQKYGVSEHTKRIGEADAKKYLRGLLGRVSYALQIRPDDAWLVKAKCELLKLIKERH